MIYLRDPAQVAGLSRFFKIGPGQYWEGEVPALMRECVDYTIKNYSKEIVKLEDRKMVKAKEAASLVGKNVSTIHRWKNSGYLHAKSVGGRDYFYMDEIKELTTYGA